MSARRREEEQPWQGEPGGSGLEPLDHCGPPPCKDLHGASEAGCGGGEGSHGTRDAGASWSRPGPARRLFPSLKLLSNVCRHTWPVKPFPTWLLSPHQTQLLSVPASHTPAMPKDSRFLSPDLQMLPAPFLYFKIPLRCHLLGKDSTPELLPAHAAP